MSLFDLDHGQPQIPAEGPQPPPESSRELMGGAADVMGVSVDAVDSDGANRFSRADSQRAETGPLAVTLADRLTGSSAEVDARGAQEGGGRADPTLAARVSGTDPGPPNPVPADRIEGESPRALSSEIDQGRLVGEPVEAINTQPNPLPFRTGELPLP